MKGGKKKYRKTGYRIMLLALIASAISIRALAAEKELALDPGTEEDIAQENIMIDFPVIEVEGQPFDFILDPQGLIYETDAMRYGGGTVEPGATLLFHNTEGDYDFSRHSDFLEVKNKGTVPVVVTISARMSDIGEIEMAETGDFSGDRCERLYLALVDNVGNISPLSAEREAAITFELSPTPENSYSFGLTGACSPNAGWQNVNVHPVVTVTWSVEPLQRENVPEESSENLQGGDVGISESGADGQATDSETANVPTIEPGKETEGEGKDVENIKADAAEPGKETGGESENMEDIKSDPAEPRKEEEGGSEEIGEIKTDVAEPGKEAADESGAAEKQDFVEPPENTENENESQ